MADTPKKGHQDNNTLSEIQLKLGLYFINKINQNYKLFLYEIT